MRLCAWRNNITGESKISWTPFNGDGRALGFCGISIASSEIFDLITETGKFSITDLYLRLAKSELIEGYLHTGRWADLDTVEKLRAAEQISKSTNAQQHIPGIRARLKINCSKTGANTVLSISCEKPRNMSAPIFSPYSIACNEKVRSLQ